MQYLEDKMAWPSTFNPDLPIEETKTECNHSTVLADRETKHEDIYLSIPKIATLHPNIRGYTLFNINNSKCSINQI